MSQDTAKSTVDIASWRDRIEKALSQRLTRAGVEHAPATTIEPGEVHTAFRIDETAIREKQEDARYIEPALKGLIGDIQKIGKKHVTVLLDVQDVHGCPGIAIRLFPQE